MIFVTIGSMFPFDRFIRVMDGYAAAYPDETLFAQIGNGEYEPVHMDFARKLSQADFSATMAKAEVIVAHAGMGTVITAGRVGRPVVIMPRILEWGEHTTDHQIATANWLRDKPGIFVADTDDELPDAIERARAAGLDGAERFPPTADPEFTDRIRAAILS